MKLDLLIIMNVVINALLTKECVNFKKQIMDFKEGTGVDVIQDGQDLLVQFLSAKTVAIIMEFVKIIILVNVLKDLEEITVKQTVDVKVLESVLKILILVSAKKDIDLMINLNSVSLIAKPEMTFKLVQLQENVLVYGNATKVIA